MLPERRFGTPSHLPLDRVLGFGTIAAARGRRTPEGPPLLGVALSTGQTAERLVEDRIRAALPTPEYRVFANVEWTGRTRDHGQLSDGEADP
jgi:hypothetical protein